MIGLGSCGRVLAVLLAESPADPDESTTRGDSRTDDEAETSECGYRAVVLELRWPSNFPTNPMFPVSAIMSVPYACRAEYADLVAMMSRRRYATALLREYGF